MKSTIFSLLFLLMASASLLSQPVVHEGDILLQSQAQVDSFPLNYPGVSHVVGNVLIGKFDTIPSDITGLGALQSLQLVTGSLYIIRNAQLKQLQGLNQLDSVYSTVLIQRNDSLLTLEGLDSLKLCTILEIMDNPGLVSTVGMSSFKRADWQFHFRGNENLETVTGFHNLDSVELFYIDQNSRLKTIEDFPALTYVEDLFILDNDSLKTIGNFPFAGYINAGFITEPYSIWQFKIENCPELNSIGSFSAMDSIFSLQIINCPKLKDIDGLSNLKMAQAVHFENTGIQSFFFPQLERVRYQLKLIGNDSLHSLAGLQPAYDSIHTVIVQDNDALTDLQGLNNLARVKDLEIWQNDNLLSLDGLEALASAYDDVGISSNNLLTSLAGLRNLETIGPLNYEWQGGLYIGYNNSLVSFDSVFNLKYMSEQLRLIQNPALETVNDVFQNLEKARGIQISNCHALNSVNGFNSLDTLGGSLRTNLCENLQSISGFQNLSYVGSSISMNYLPRLDTIVGFNQFNRCGRQIKLWYLDSLRSIDAFASLTYVEDSLTIRYNPSLGDCSALCQILDNAHIGKGVKLEDNAFPCSDLSDVEVFCDTMTLASEPLPPEKRAAKEITLYPNPAAAAVLVQLPANLLLPCSLEVHCSNGAVLLQKTQTQRQAKLQLDGLPEGPLFIKAIDKKGNSASGKLMLTGK